MAHPEDDRARPGDLLSLLPERVWYLTSTGQDMWCRRPYGFFFSSSEAAARFAREAGSALELSPIAVTARDLLSPDGLAAIQRLSLTRLFLDPRIDSESGDVFGTILRLAPAP